MTITNQIVEPSALARPSTVIAPELLGCYLVRRLSEVEIIRGLIVETEAYAPGDPACHGYKKRTERNDVMFGTAGRGYVYLIYGMYHCFNVVTDGEGIPSAVLIRALLLDSLPAKTAAGPGKLCRVMQIDRSLNGVILQPNQPLWLEGRTPAFVQQLAAGAISFVQTTRIGLTQGTDLPWRWYIKNCPAVSKI